MNTEQQSSIVSSPEKMTNGWTINPVKVPRANLKNDMTDPAVMVLHESDSEYKSNTYDNTESYNQTT